MYCLSSVVVKGAKFEGRKLANRAWYHPIYYKYTCADILTSRNTSNSHRLLTNMPMLSVATILHIVKLILLVTVFILGIVYITLSIIGRRLRTSIDLLLFNVCVACTLCASFWILYDILDIIRSPWLQDDDLCWFYSYAQNLSVCQVVYAFCFVSLNRYLMVTYASNMYFKRRQWALISMGAQWLLGCLLPAPLWLSQVR